MFTNIHKTTDFTSYCGVNKAKQDGTDEFSVPDKVS